MRVARPVELNSEVRKAVERLARGRSLPARVVERASIVLRAADGLQDKEIAQELGVTAEKVARWRNRLHKHLGQDEILYIEKGTVHVHLGDQERDLHAGGTVFIPAYTFVSVKNVGTETVSVVFVFSAPGFENYMRCDSVLPNEKVTPLSLEEQRGCAHAGHVIYEDLEENPKK